MKRIIIAVLVAVFCCTGCALFAPEKEKTAQELADEGMRAFDKENYGKAIKSFEKLKDWYPFSKYAKTAELKIADSYFELSEYEEAVMAYSEFERLHPRYETIDEVVYKIGMCHFNRMESIDRDQTFTQNALDTFIRLKQQFPGSSFAEKASEKITVCINRLAGADMYVGKFYFKAKHYKGAEKRFQSVLRKYPESDSAAEAWAFIEKCREKLAQETAVPQ